MEKNEDDQASTLRAVLADLYRFRDEMTFLAVRPSGRGAIAPYRFPDS